MLNKFSSVVRAEVLYDFDAIEPTELSLKKGDIVVVLQQGDPSSWWKGELNGKVGLFPGNYVKIIAPEVIKAEVLYDFDATESIELSIKKGDRVVVLHQRDGSSWWEGELNGKVGLFPGNYVKIIVPAVIKAEFIYAEVLYDFDAIEPTELSLKKGDTVVVFQQGDPSSWWKGELNGKVGYFPGNYVKIISSARVDKNNENIYSSSSVLGSTVNPVLQPTNGPFDHNKNITNHRNNIESKLKNEFDNIIGEESGGRRQRMGIEGVGKVRYVGVIKLIEGYHPPLSCYDHMIQDLPVSLNGIGDIHLIADEAKRFAEDRLTHLPLNEKKLSMDEAIAIAAFSFDLGFNSNTEDGSDNLFVILNNTLRERNGGKMIKLKPFLYYLMSGLSKLDGVNETVYRGIPSSTLSIIQEKYLRGSEIHWSAFTSTTTSLRTAKCFANRNGIIFRIKVSTGRSIINYSSFPDEEEILLSPNWRAFVFSECHLENDGYYYVDLVERIDSSLIF